MTVTFDSVTRQGSVTIVRVSSDLAGGSPVYFHWYMDGAFIDMTSRPSVNGVATSSKGFSLVADDQARLVVLDTLDANFNSIASAPAGYPARRTLTWIRSVDVGTVRYRVDQQKDSDPVTTIGVVRADATTWQYRFLTPRLGDLANYTWTIVPLDAVGNVGTTLTIGPELIVRSPDAPAFGINVNPNVNPDPAGATIEFVAA